MAERCECGLACDPPKDWTRILWWFPSIDPPARGLSTVVRFGEPASCRRAVRVPSGWLVRGASVECPGRPDVVLAWERLGLCWADTEHPVVVADTERPVVVVGRG